MADEPKDSRFRTGIFNAVTNFKRMILSPYKQTPPAVGDNQSSGIQEQPQPSGSSSNEPPGQESGPWSPTQQQFSGYFRGRFPSFFSSVSSLTSSFFGEEPTQPGDRTPPLLRDMPIPGPQESVESSDYIPSPGQMVSHAASSKEQKFVFPPVDLPKPEELAQPLDSSRPSVKPTGSHAASSDEQKSVYPSTSKAIDSAKPAAQPLDSSRPSVKSTGLFTLFKQVLGIKSRDTPKRYDLEVAGNPPSPISPDPGTQATEVSDIYDP